MKKTCKPVRKCHKCLLNLGDHCWLYAYPRGQWRSDRVCPAFGNPDACRRFAEWKKQPDVKTSRQIRQYFFRKSPGGRGRRPGAKQAD